MFHSLLDRSSIRRRFQAVGAAIAVGAAALVAPAATQAAGLLVADGGFGGVLEIKEQDVRVTINNSIAVTQIDQVFVNTEQRQVEALYTFPVPREASVSNFSMWINGKEMIGEVVEKERAREIYNSYKRQRRDPGLLEQVDFKQFEMRIFPIAAGAEQRIRIEYYQQLDVDHDWATYVYPLATDTRGQAIDSRVRGRFSLMMDIKSEVPINEVRCESHPDDFVMINHDPEYAQASMELSEGDLSRDIVLAVETKRPRTGLDMVTSRPSGEAGYFMMTLTPGEDLAATALPSDYVFLLDVSGSMARDGKLKLSQSSVGAFINTLGENDRFECVAFNLAPQPLFNEKRTPSAANVEEALQFLEAQRARGGTVLQPALTSAYSYLDSDRPLNVVLLSDGMTEAGEQAELMRLIQSRPSGVRVFCIGIGNEVNKPLLSQMANQAGGMAAFVSTEDSFQRQAHLMRQKLIRPAIQDVVINFNGSSINEVEPKQLGDVFHGTPLRIFGRYETPGMVEMTVKGVIDGAQWKETVEVELPAEDKGNSEIERMWAQKRVQRLLDEEAGGLSSNREEIVRLCEAYSIVSPHASMLVLENDAEYKRWKIEQRNAVRISRDRQSRTAIQEKLAQLRQRTNMSFESMRGEKLVTANEAKSAPGSANPATPMSPPNSTPNATQPVTPPQPHRGVDFTIPNTNSSRPNTGGGGGGGGAIEPLTALLSIGTAGAAALARRRKQMGSGTTGSGTTGSGTTGSGTT